MPWVKAKLQRQVDRNDKFLYFALPCLLKITGYSQHRLPSSKNWFTFCFQCSSISTINRQLARRVRFRSSHSFALISESCGSMPCEIKICSNSRLKSVSQRICCIVILSVLEFCKIQEISMPISCLRRRASPYELIGSISRVLHAQRWQPLFDFCSFCRNWPFVIEKKSDRIMMKLLLN